MKAFIVGIIIFIFIRTFFFSNYVVEGESMMPTLKDGNKLMVNKIGFQITDLDRFDVIVFHANEREDYVKRIIGLPGDEIEYKDDKLYINGEEYEEPYLDGYRQMQPGQPLTGDFTLTDITGKKKVPEGKLFVMGDNRLESWDSRHFGFIPSHEVVGKVNLLYWPIKDVAISP
ncbi:signal peptidase I [Bacillus sp. FJAT-27225]|uniref:signal peptidase I n=1 Tax=Bacillus sp. FJAT-27225 TaxID=1743144 RepID=UPI00080C26B6|nr:signal peptidase I [Bacillus sp. FJAT-27225]OCA84550.1 signal peptidase I [Bacillus sp. FJAT-27225]